ncbi:sulfatase-like hydrolase/transferase [Botrimarina hoheduenensis]|uniref:Arylsulfatase n=1 Tax=Botrimarina hoheduenensis TaxID=2528000 RepID=A0A5C5WCJ8_9BACT|nr:sulfatase-like hydrolase/transferase [Botrimarina hoheduenensis]TWT47843.1 Arylsulfatase [Botrimarina hoheduenensis]
MKIASVTLACCLLLISSISEVAGTQPNVVLIISDDAGWADYGFVRNATADANPGGAGAVPTPHLDRLASAGVVFTNAYTASVCSPSRAMITTGQYGMRFGYGSNIMGGTDPIHTAANLQGLPTSAITIWERMQSVGYSTAAIGKWHLGEHANGGGQLGNRPENQGIEHFEGLWGGSRSFFVGGATNSEALRRTVSDGMGAITSNAIIENDYSGQYVTDVFGDQSVDYIRDSANTANPFFLYSSFTAPHTPMQATAADLAYIDTLNIPGFTGQRRTYAAMQYAMDRNVGKILDALDDPNGDGNTADSIADNTLLLFINDNGGDCCDIGPNSSDNGVLRNGKGSQFEGGMRVPMIVAGAGVKAAVRGTVSTNLVHAIDLVPTAFSGAGGGAFAANEIIDGKNLLPYINSEVAGVAHEELFIPRYNNLQSAVRKGSWKYMYQPGTGYQLYNLASDPDESSNVVALPGNAGVVEEMHQLLASYHVQMDKPRYDNQGPETNDFDHFRFRAEALATAAFSTTGAWLDGDSPNAPQTASWREGYADNRLTFPARSGASYTVTNDLTSVGGFAYMASRLSLASASAPLTGEHSARIDGLPIMLTASRSGAGPVIELDATDAVPNAFTFNHDTDIVIYDDLSITGDGNQRFVFGGQLREFRSQQSVTKTGTAGLTLAGGVDLTGTLHLQGGRVAFTNGQMRGNLVAMAGVTVQVGPAGIVPREGGGSGTPRQIVSTGLELNYDAALDISGDSLWSNAASGTDSLSFSAPASVSAISSSVFPRLTSAYSIPLTGGAGGLSDFFEQSGPRSRQDGTFEVVFHVSDLSAGTDQVLLETGGAARGVALVINNGVLTFNVDGDASDYNLTTNLSTGWHQAVGVIDLSSADDSMTLYLDNQLVGTLSGLTIGDWAGGNPLGLGAGESSVTGVTAGTGQPYHGEIALARYYSNAAFGSTEVDTNYQWLLESDPVTSGQPAVTLAIDGDFSVQNGTSLEMDLLDTVQHDRVEATGAATLGGQLKITASAGFAPTAGDAYAMVAGETVQGVFSTVDLPALDTGLMWQVAYGPSSVSILVTLAGDYNGDLVVDLADYTVWRDTLGLEVSPHTGADGDGDGQVTPADLQIWQAQFGAVVPALSSDTAIPEPATILATGSMLGGILLGTSRR